KSITIGLPVSDLEKSASWYEKLLMSDEKLVPVEGVIEYQIGSVWIQLFEEKINASKNVLCLEAENLEVEFERLKTLGIITNEVIEELSGILRYFDFTDPDGNKLSFYWLYEQE
ncbi:TPA: VOC family protein, partial [Listeria monocytogenes]|nr:VOC family protein [Listeria monocytogenes]HBL8464992.1 VOC family protein [Listeria monocytogenes]HEM2122979.1 VOC family protein [Listeria monocytogenes]HEM2318049.1 VOC family protein [Listeria monocytogenes]HEM2387750.1 VOC family protein [Listeria monocytogenes]